MPTISIIYFSESDTTHNLAVAVGQGCEYAANVSVNLLRIQASDIVNARFQNNETMTAIDQSDGIVFGSPTYMGGPAAQFKAFADASSERWTEQAWAGKIAAGFTVGASPNGDQLATLQYFSILAAQHSMLWANLATPGYASESDLNPMGTQLGLAAHCDSPSISDVYQATAECFGKHIATTVQRLHC